MKEEEKYCSKCGRELRQTTRTKNQVIDNINKMLKTNSWDLKGKLSHLLAIEKAIEELKSEGEE